MTHLGDFVGQLVSEIAMARVQADLEALRVAEHYARDPLLKHLPVPRFRLPTVTLRVPVAVADTAEQPDGVPPRGGLDPKLILSTATTVIDAEIAPLKVTKAERALLVRELTAYVQRVSVNPDLVASATSVADAIVKIVLGVLDSRRSRDADGVATVAEAIREKLTDQFVDLRIAPPRLSVLASASELRDATNILTMDLTLTEESVEWAVVDTLSGTAKRLVIE